MSDKKTVDELAERFLNRGYSKSVWIAEGYLIGHQEGFTAAQNEYEAKISDLKKALDGGILVATKLNQKIQELEDKLYHASREAPLVEYELNHKIAKLESQLVASERMRRDEGLRTYDGLAQRCERYKNALIQIQINFGKITKCEDQKCDGCHMDAKIAGEIATEALKGQS